MSGNRLTVDVEALRRSGVNIEGMTALAASICAGLQGVVEDCGDAGGTGEMGQQFALGYKPGAERGMAFLKLLGDTLGETGVRTVETAQTFESAVDEADAQRFL